MKKVNKFIRRKTLIYKTDVEYGDYTINHLQGCAHGCEYPCYAFIMKKRFGQIKSYEDWCNPAIVENTLELLDIEIPRYRDKIKMLHLCFTTDPFMYEYDEICDLSLKAISKLNAAGIPCSILTKGVLPAELAQYSNENEYGITLVSLNEDFRKKVEPGSAPYDLRLQALKLLHDQGCKTWVSIEPYPTPNLLQQDLADILEAVSFVDKIIFGRMNYNKDVSSYKGNKQFYNEKATEVIKFCEERGISYHIKDGTITE